MSEGTQSNSATSATPTQPRWQQALNDGGGSPAPGGGSGQNSGGGAGGGGLPGIRGAIAPPQAGGPSQRAPTPRQLAPAGTPSVEPQPGQTPPVQAPAQQTPPGQVQQTPPDPGQGAPSATPGAPSAASAAGQIFQLTQEQMDAMLSRISPQGQPQAQPQYSEEQLNQMFNVYRVGAEALKVLGIENPTEEQAAFFNNIIQGAARQAVTVASFALAHQVEQLKSLMTPMQQFYNTQHQEALKGRFLSKYPNLKGYEPLLEKVRDSIIQSGRKVNSEDEAFKLVAEETVAILKNVPGLDSSKLLNGQAVAAAAPNGQNHQQAQQPSGMPQLAGGGQGGAGDTGATGNQNVPKWKRALS